METLKQSCSKNRLKNIDHARGIVILLVVIGHLVPFNGYPFRIIFSFHMPFFFIMSGYCSSLPVKDISFGKHFLKSVKHLWMASIFWRFIFWGVGFWSASLFEGIISVFLDGSLEWFIMDLFACQIFFWFYLKLEKHLNKAPWISALLIFTICAIAPAAMTFYRDRWHHFPYSPICWDSAIIGFSFLLIGYFLRRKLTLQENLISFTHLQGLIVKFVLMSMIVVTLIGIWNNSYVNIVNCYLGDSTIFFYFTSIFGTLLILIFSTWIENVSSTHKSIRFINNLLEFYGRNTIIIYPGHMIIFFLFNKLIAVTTGVLLEPMVTFPPYMIPIYFFLCFLLLTPIIFLWDYTKNFLLKRKVKRA